MSSIQETQQTASAAAISQQTTSGIATANSTLTKIQTKQIRQHQQQTSQLSGGFNSNHESQQSASSFITASNTKRGQIVNQNDPLDRQLTDVSSSVQLMFNAKLGLILLF